MELSDGVTWEDCPNCQRVAAVDWVHGLLDFHCPAGCSLSAEQRQIFAARRGRPPLAWLTRL